jgi:hypothetical protein
MILCRQSPRNASAWDTSFGAEPQLGQRLSLAKSPARSRSVNGISKALPHSRHLKVHVPFSIS